MIGTTDLNETIKSLMEQKESIILEQLSELISRGLLVVEETSPVLVRKHNPEGLYGVELKQAVRLVLKDQEYIEKLEAKVAELEGCIKEQARYINNSSQ